MVKRMLKYSCLAGAASLMASPAFAQEAPAHSVFHPELITVFDVRVFGDVHGLRLLYA